MKGFFGQKGLRGFGNASASFSPLSLFAASEPGLWYDPSDISTLFQDAAGTTPVTAAGQSVGLMLDKSKGLVLGPELVPTGTVGIIGTATAATYNTSTGAGSVTRVDLSNQSFVSIGSLVNGNFYRVQITVHSGTILLRAGTATGSTLATLTAGSTSLLVTPTTALVIATTVGTATFTLTSFRELPGNHATQSTSLSRPTYQVDSNGRGYLLFDGSDDFLVTPTITPGTDKAQVFAGVRFTAANSNGTILESSGAADGNNGSFFLRQQAGGANNFQWLFRSTTNTSPTTPYTLPVTAVISATSDFAAPLTVTRLNGVQISSTLLPTGGGNFLTYTHFIGRRNGTTLPFNGRIYSLICRFGPNLTADQIAQAEAWMNSKTGAY